MGISDMVHEGYAPSPGAAIAGNVAYIPPGFADFYKEPFTYNVIVNPATAGAVTPGQTQIQNDSYFVWTQGTVTIWDAATQRTTNIQPNLAPLLVRVFDSSSGKVMMDQPTPIGNVFGTGLNPVVFLYRAKIFQPGGQIQVEVTNQLAADQAVRMSFTGFKIYKVADSAAPM